MIEVPEGSPVELDLRLESVVEGVLVSGSATVQVRGECVRCLAELATSREIELQELFVYPSSEVGEDEAGRLQGDLIDVEPLLRDRVVVELPFRPLCRSECLGLCPQCGVDLNADPDHQHESPADSRWARLASFPPPGASTYDEER